MLSDKVVVGLAVLEVFLYGGAVYGFSFIQAILEAENIYWEDFCYQFKI